MSSSTLLLTWDSSKMDDSKSLLTEEEKKGLPPDVKFFMGKAYLVEVERGTFALQRDLIIEFFNKEERKVNREKLKTLGPIGLFRQCEGDEKADLRTIHPTTMKELQLKNIGQV